MADADFGYVPQLHGMVLFSSCDCKLCWLEEFRLHCTRRRISHWVLFAFDNCGKTGGEAFEVAECASILTSAIPNHNGLESESGQLVS